MGAIFRSHVENRVIIGLGLACMALGQNDAAVAQPKSELPICTKVIGDDGSPLHPISTFTMSDPLAGRSRTVEIGQSILSSMEVAELPDTLVLHEPISYAGVGPAKGFAVNVPAGTLRVSTDTATYASYKAAAGSVRKDDTAADATVELVRKTDSTQPIRLFWLHRFSSFFSNGSQPFADDIPSAKYEIRGCIGPTKTNFRKEIVYSGVAGRSLSLLYREFAGDLARPAFSQNLTYDLSAGDEIGYKGARLRITAATNTSISYEVIRALD